MRLWSALLVLLTGAAVGGCRHPGDSTLAEAEQLPLNLMDPKLWEPSGDLLSSVFPGTDAGWLTTGPVWTLPGMTALRATVVHQGKTRPNHMQYSVKTKATFQEFHLAFDFRFEPEDPLSLGAATWFGNSGIYIFGLYEIQIFRAGYFDARPVIPRQDVANGVVERQRGGLTLKVPASQFLCGSVYDLVAPTSPSGDFINQCADDQVWHHMVIAFTPAKFAGDVKQASATVAVTIDGVALEYGGVKTFVIPGPTGSQHGRPEVSAGPLVLQDHGSRVSFRGLTVY